MGRAIHLRISVYNKGNNKTGVRSALNGGDVIESRVNTPSFFYSSLERCGFCKKLKMQEENVGDKSTRK